MLTSVIIAGALALGGVLIPEVADSAASWRQFGGPGRDFSVDSRIEPWPESGPKLLWDRQLGSGYSAVVGDHDQIFTHYRDSVDEGAVSEDEIVIALDATSGATLWEHRYRAPAREEHLVQFGAGPHATPLLLEDRVVTLGYTGILRALDRRSGELLWGFDLVEELGGLVTPWGFSASPIFHRGLVIVLVGGTQGVLALAPEDGSIRWKSEAGSVSYSTPRVLEVAGREELVFFAKDSVRSIDPENGRTLWSHTVVNGYENHASNLLWDGQSLLWVASQQEAGGRLLRLGGEGQDPEVVWQNRKVRLHHWNAVLLDGVVYGSLGDSAHIFSAINLATGKILWRDRRFGLVKMLRTPSATLLLSEDGDLSLVRLTAEGAELLASASVSDELSRTVPTLLGTTLYVRDSKRIRAFDLSQPEQADVLSLGPTVDGSR